MARKTPAYQLDREIEAALATPRARRHHTTRPETPDDAWLVVMDALMNGDAAQAANVWNNLYDEHDATVPPERFKKALKSKGKNKIDKAVFDEFKRLAPDFGVSLKRTARIVPGGMGNFLDPPEYPTHQFHIGYGRRQGGSSLTSNSSVESIDPLTRKEVRGLLDNWKKNRPPIDSPEVRKWISEVLGYMATGYRNPNAGDKQWDASKLVFDSKRDPVRNAKDHAGVHLIRKFYPDFTPTDDDFAGARWGNA